MHFFRKCPVIRICNYGDHDSVYLSIAVWDHHDVLTKNESKKQTAFCTVYSSRSDIMRTDSLTRIMAKAKNGYMTVEATVVFPLMIFAFAILMYLVLFVYNRAVLGNDTALVSLYAAEEYHSDPDTFLAETEKHFSV